MHKDLHDPDDFFRSAYKQFEDIPSADVWKKINANLDKKDADSNRKKFILWRGIAIFLVFILTGFILFDAGVFKSGAGYSDDDAGSQKSNQAGLIPKKEVSNHKSPNPVKREVLLRDEKVLTKKFNGVNYFPLKQNVFDNINVKPGAGTENTEKITNLFLDKNESLLREEINPIPLNEKNTTESPSPELKARTPLPIMLNFALNTAIKKHEKDIFFAPYWSLTAFVSNDRANYKLDSDLPGNITSIKHREVHEPSFSGGILATRQFTEHWGLQSGIIYSHTAIGISQQKIYAFQDPAGDIAYRYITSSGYAYIKPANAVPPSTGDSLNTLEAKHTLKQIIVPLSAKYRIGKNKLSVTPGSGIEANFFTSANVEIEIENPNSEIVFINKLRGAKSFYLSATLDADLQYKLTDKVSLNLQPSFRHALSPITDDNVVETFPYGLSIRAGVTYKF